MIAKQNPYRRAILGICLPRKVPPSRSHFKVAEQKPASSASSLSNLCNRHCGSLYSPIESLNAHSADTLKTFAKTQRTSRCSRVTKPEIFLVFIGCLFCSADRGNPKNPSSELLDLLFRRPRVGLGNLLMPHKFLDPFADDVAEVDVSL